MFDLLLFFSSSSWGKSFHQNCSQDDNFDEVEIDLDELLDMEIKYRKEWVLVSVY